MRILYCKLHFHNDLKFRFLNFVCVYNVCVCEYILSMYLDLCTHAHLSVCLWRLQFSVEGLLSTLFLEMVSP